MKIFASIKNSKGRKRARKVLLLFSYVVHISCKIAPQPPVMKKMSGVSNTDKEYSQSDRIQFMTSITTTTAEILCPNGAFLSHLSLSSVFVTTCVTCLKFMASVLCMVVTLLDCTITYVVRGRFLLSKTVNIYGKT